MGGDIFERLRDGVCGAGVARLRVSLSLACYAEAGFVLVTPAVYKLLRPSAHTGLPGRRKKA